MADWRLFPDAVVTGPCTDTGAVSKQKISPSILQENKSLKKKV